jgi:hypothetical protein
MIASNIVSELGKAHYERREIPEALDCFLTAIECGADPKIDAFQRWSSWMLLGEFEQAWKVSDETGTSFHGPLPITGGRVLIRCLRGLGDAIQFLRYAFELRQRCDHVTVQAPSRLLPLCRLVPGIDLAISLDSPLDDHDYDYQMECSDLHYVFRTTESTIPCRHGYFRASSGQVGSCPSVLSPRRDSVKAGIVWAAASWNPGRSIPLALLEQLAHIPGLALFSLQKGPEAGQLRTFFFSRRDCRRRD